MSFDATAFFENLKAGDRIDVEDQEGDWFETIVRKVVGNKIVCHFWGFANIWDCTIEYEPFKIAPVHTHSERSKYKDTEKLLGECVWEILSLKNMLNAEKQCTNESYLAIQRDTGISMENMQSFLDSMDAPDPIQLKLCKFVQKNVIEMGLKLRIQELMENGANCFGFDAEIQSNINTIKNMNNIKRKIKNNTICQIPNISHISATNTSLPSHQEIKPLNLANLANIDLPEIPDIEPISKQISSQSQQSTVTGFGGDSSISNTDENSSNSNTNTSYIDHSNTNTNIMDTQSARFMIKMNGEDTNTNVNMDNKDDNIKQCDDIESNENTAGSTLESDISTNTKKSRKRKQSVPSKKPKKRRKKSEESLFNSTINKVLVTKYDHNAIKKGWMDVPSKEDLKPGNDGKYRCPSQECIKKPPFKTYTSTCRHIQIEHQGYRYRCDLCREEYSTEVEFRSHSTLKIHLSNMHKLTKDDFIRIRIVLSLVGNDSLVKKTAGSDEDKFKKWKQNIIDQDAKRMSTNGGKKKLLHVTKKSRSILKKLPVFGLANNTGAIGDRHHTKKSMKKKKIIKTNKSEIKTLLKKEESATSSSSIRSVSGTGTTTNSNNTLSSSNDSNSLGLALNMDVDIDLNLDLNTSTSSTSRSIRNNAASSAANNHKDKAFMDRIDQLIQNLETDPNKTNTKKKNRKPICEFCGQKFKNFQALGGHKKKHNPNWGRNRKKKKKKKRRRKKGESIDLSDMEDDDEENEDDEEEEDEEDEEEEEEEEEEDENEEEEESEDDIDGDNESDQDYDIEINRNNGRNNNDDMNGDRMRNNNNNNKRRIRRDHDGKRDNNINDDDIVPIENDVPSPKSPPSPSSSSLMDINRMPQFKIRMKPPPPPPRGGNKGKNGNMILHQNPLYMMSPTGQIQNGDIMDNTLSVYEIQEKKNDLYFEYRMFDNDRDIKEYPFGPLWISGVENGGNEVKWVKKAKTRISKKFGCTILHFDDS